MYYITNRKIVNNPNTADVSLINYQEFTLPNNLRVILSRDDSIPSVALNLTYHVGSKDELIGQKGFAHLIEHLMFEGSPNLAAGEYDRLTVERGCESNAYTTEDKTCYYIVAPSNQTEFILWLESNRLRGLDITEETIEIQKNIILEEKKQLCDNRPYGSFSFELPPRLFGSGSYATDVLGLENDIRNAEFQEIIKFYNNYYRPDNLVLTISGDIEIDNTYKLIEKYFSDILPENIMNRPVYHSSDVNSEIHDIIYDNIHLPAIFISYIAPKENSEESYAFDTLTGILSSGESSWLNKNLVRDCRLANDTSAWYESRECSGVFTIYASLLPETKPYEVIKKINEILQKLKDGLISDSDMERVKNRIETRNVFLKSTNISKADMLSHYKIFYNDVSEINSISMKYNSVTISYLRDVAHRYLNGDKRVILEYHTKN